MASKIVSFTLHLRPELCQSGHNCRTSIVLVLCWYCSEFHCYWIWWCVQHCHSFATSFNWMHSFDEEQHWTFFVSYSAWNWISGQCFIRDSRPASNVYGVLDYVTSMYAGILRTLRFFMILVLEYCTEKIQAFTAVPSVAAGRVYLDWGGWALDKSLTRFTAYADSSYFRASTCIQCTHYVEQVLGFSGLSGRLPMWELLQRSCYSWDVCSFLNVVCLYAGTLVRSGSDTSEICRTFKSSTSFECSLLFFEP